MIRVRQRNVVWLGILGAFTGVSFVAAAPIAPLLLAMLGGAGAASFLRLNTVNTNTLVEAMQQRVPLSASGVRVTPQAREAITRAEQRGFIPMPQLALIDLGLIASSRGEDGLAMRRTRSISKDDDGVRPFIVLYVDPSEADRNAKLRFEIIDQNGRELYVHEMNCYLRDGEVNILAENHLPLMSNTQVEGSGDWDLRVYLDGQLIAMHSFMLSPSDAERRNRLGNTGSTRARRYIMPEPESRLADDTDSEAPLSLEDLLRDQRNQQRRNSSR